MSKEQVRNLILNVVNESPGVQGIELVVKCHKRRALVDDDPYSDENIDDTIDIIDEIDELVNDGNLVEIEYTLTSMSYRTKMVYFPKGTKISVKNG